MNLPRFLFIHPHGEVLAPRELREQIAEFVPKSLGPMETKLGQRFSSKQMYGKARGHPL